MSTANAMNDLMLMNWVSGYLSAINKTSAETFDLAPESVSTSAPAYDWIRGYCRRNPLDTVTQATFAYVLEAWPMRQMQAPQTDLPPPPSVSSPAGRNTTPPPPVKRPKRS